MLVAAWKTMLKKETRLISCDGQQLLKSLWSPQTLETSLAWTLLLLNQHFARKFQFWSYYNRNWRTENRDMTCFKFSIQIVGWISQTIFLTINSALFILSITGNSLVMYLVWTKPVLRSPTYFLMSFLALSDLLTSLFGQLSYCISSTFFKDISCNKDKGIAFVNASSCTCSLLLLSLIARDRYLHVSKQQDYSNYTSIRFSIIASILCYLLGMIVASLFTFDDMAIKISSTFAFATLGAFSFTFICLKARQIKRIVYDHNQNMQATSRANSILNENASARCRQFEKAVNRSIFSVIILFFVSWTPVITLMMIITVHNFLNEPIPDRYRLAFAWGSTVSYFNGALNPIIYGYRCDAIGRHIRRILRKAIGRKDRVVPASSRVDAVDIDISTLNRKPHQTQLTTS